MTSQPANSPPPSPAADSAPQIWRIGDWRVEPERLVLARDGEDDQRLEPKIVDLLVFLAERSPEVVTREEIFERVWEGRAVVDGALSRAVSLLRQALGDDTRNPRYIETIPRQGYRLVAEVQRSARAGRSDTGPAPPSAAAEPPVVEEPVVEKTVVAESAHGSPAARRLWPWAAVALSLGLAAWWMSGPRPQPSPSQVEGPIRMAVLPFDNLSGREEDQYVADGLTEELIHQLSALSALGVVSRTSVLAVKDEGWRAPEIARKLRVAYLLEGSVIVADQRLRITVQLIAPERDEHLWSRTYDRSMVDVLDLHREVSMDVTAQVEAELTVPEKARLAARESVNGEAYRLYLQGRQRLERRTRRDLKEARELLRRAVELDPSLAVAWAASANLHLLSELYLRVPQAQAYGRAQKSIDRALELDPNLATAHVSLGLLRLTRDWDWAGSEAAYRTAIRLEPSYALAHQWLSEMLSLSGRHQEALEAVARAVDLDPLSPLVHAAWGQRLNAAGRHREALQRFATADDLGAGFAWHLREAAYAHERLGDVRSASVAHMERMARRGVDGRALEELRAAVASEGLPGYWRWQHGRLAALPSSEPMQIAEALAGSGAHEEAWPWLKIAHAKRGTWFLHMLKSPALDPIRDDPQFQAWIEEIRP